MEIIKEKIQQMIHQLRDRHTKLEIQKNKLEESELIYRRLSEEMPAMLCMFLPDSTLIYVNRAYCDYFGKQPDELMGKRFLDFLPEEDRNSLMQEYLSLTPASPTGSSEHPVIRPDGTRRWHGWTNRAFFDENEKIRYFQAIGKDITSQRDAEESFRKAALAAESATRSKSEFFASMSHEIRTPMNAVINMIRLLQDTPLNDEQKEYVETTMIASKILLSLINEILDFSKIEAGKLGIEHIEFKLTDIVESVIRILKLRAEEKNLFLAHQIESTLDNCFIGDPVRISQIMINLINNAIKFTHKGGISIRVFLKNEDDFHYIVGFEITDTGIGIPEDYKALMFQPFSQADYATSRKYGGTGLGLTISKQLAELMGGEIGVESVKGSGSTFWFTAKLEKSNTTTHQCHNPDAVEEYIHEESDYIPERSNPVSSFHGSAFCTSEQRDASILIAEDDTINQIVAVSILRKFGFTADIAANGMEAVEALRKKEYDLVFMDMDMPKMGGIQATKIIRNRYSGVLNPDVAIIAMTAHTGEIERQGCLEAGMNDFITKPVEPDELLSIIHKSIRKN